MKYIYDTHGKKSVIMENLNFMDLDLFKDLWSSIRFKSQSLTNYRSTHFIPLKSLLDTLYIFSNQCLILINIDKG